MTRGAVSTYTPNIAIHICESLIDGDSLKLICKPDDMPSCVTVYAWLNKGLAEKEGDYRDFLNLYIRAREEQGEGMVDEMLTISDDKELDANQKRIMIDTRKWIASKLKPQKYGDKLDLNHGAQSSFSDMMKEIFD